MGEIVVVLILAKCERSKELGIFVWFVTGVIVISVISVSHFSSTAEDLDELAYKGVDFERACQDIFGADSNSLSFCRLTTQVVGLALNLMLGRSLET